MACVAYLIVGFALGGRSSLFWERRIGAAELALLNLLITPFLAGLAMHLFGRWRQKRGHETAAVAWSG